MNLTEITTKQSKLSVTKQQTIETFKKDIDEHIKNVSTIWLSLSEERKNKLLEHSPILKWVYELGKDLK